MNYLLGDHLGNSNLLGLFPVKQKLSFLHEFHTYFHERQLWYNRKVLNDSLKARSPNLGLFPDTCATLGGHMFSPILKADVIN